MSCAPRPETTGPISADESVSPAPGAEFRGAEHGRHTEMVRCIGVGRGRVAVARRRERRSRRRPRATTSPVKSWSSSARRPTRTSATTCCARDRRRACAASAAASITSGFRGPVGRGRDRGVPRDARRRAARSRTTSATSIQNAPPAAERSVLARRQPVGPRRRFRRSRRGRTSPPGDGSVIVAEHRHRRQLHPSGSRRQHVAQPARDSRQRHRRRRQRLRRRRVRHRHGESRQRSDGRPRPRHAHGRHDRGRRQQRRRRGRRQLEREDPGVQVPRRRRDRAPTPARIECFNYITALHEPRREHPRDEQQLGRVARRRIRRRPRCRRRSTRPAPPASSTSSAPATTARTTTSSPFDPASYPSPSIVSVASSVRPIADRPSATTARRRSTSRRPAKTS